jgi:glutamine synthetase
LEEPSTNLEYKPADASCNPYIAFAGLVAAGLDGFERGLELPDPMLVDPATLSDAERERIRASRYPEDLGAALDALERDDVLTTAMGESLTTSYVAVRRSEFEAYGAMDEAAQYRGHFAKY